MSGREVHLELLLGRRVLATNGHPVGRLEEVRAERHGAGCFVTECVIGPAGLMERLSARLLPSAVTRRGFVARWEQIDLGDAEHPRLRCPVEELRRGP
ncbi:MAG: hypothetical protein DMF80_03945 [Acidobacteria bacterium]|nr:MAG: hypothetical protein DMF80_03945 [Acidobacteriota bacterium]PYQ23619.1 MAG: hypothetical protein DMF81_08170 [Acidobacteriota bacterium]